MPRVFIPNRSANNFSEAEHFGELVFVTEGYIDQIETSKLMDMIEGALSGSSPKDYIVMSSLNTLCSLLTAAFAVEHGCVNLLIFKEGSYTTKTIEF